MNALHDVRVAAATDEGPGQRALRLEPLHGQLPSFDAGAHVDVHLPDGLVRQYSIASAPHQRDHYLLCVRHVTDSRGGSRQLCGSIALGDRLQISAPRNLFPLRAGSRQVLIAAGIGITPLLSMAQALEARGEDFVLHYYVHQREQVAFSARLQRGFVHGRVLLHASTEGESARTHVPVELRAATSRDQLYLCGPAPFMDRFTALATGFGWALAQVHREHFGAALSTTTTDRAFEVELASTGQVVTVPAQVSIAHALHQAGIAVPVSCEQGICGACLTGVLAGEPEHRDSVLSPAERAASHKLVLCCSRSRSARLLLDL